MKLLLGYIKGYYLLLLYDGDVERLLNICKNHGICFEKIVHKDGKYLCRVMAKHYKDVVLFSKKVNVTVAVKKRAGIRYFFDRYRKRKIFAICMLLFLAALYYSTLFLWNISVECDGVYTDIQVKKYIEDNYVPLGTRIKNIDCDELERELRLAFPKIAWISCSLDGGMLSVVFTETVNTDVIEEGEEPCNIVALKDATVSKNIINSGMVIARKGDEVKKGDILITGVINVTNEYDELIETDYVHATGYVYGIVNYDYEDSFDISCYEKEYTGRSTKAYGLIYFNDILSLPIFGKKNYSLYDTVGESHQARLFGYRYLPFGIYTDTKREYTLKLTCYSDKEAEDKAKKRLDKYLEELRKKGVVILENNVKIDIADGVVSAHGKIKCEELIGVPSEINILNQGENN